MEMHDSHDGYFIRNESSNPPKQYNTRKEKERNEPKKKTSTCIDTHNCVLNTNTSNSINTNTSNIHTVDV